MSNPMESFVEQVSTQLAVVEDDRPIVMINLLRFRDMAQYRSPGDANPCSGSAAYARYAREALRFVTSAGGHVIWRGSPRAVLLGPTTERWDDALLVQYPSKQAFLRMIGNPDYQAITVHRTAALEDSRLIATTPTTP
jgi:uncharacterized protein (DUF1330 family)